MLKAKGRRKWKQQLHKYDNDEIIEDELTSIVIHLKLDRWLLRERWIFCQLIYKNRAARSTQHLRKHPLHHDSLVEKSHSFFCPSTSPTGVCVKCPITHRVALRLSLHNNKHFHSCLLDRKKKKKTTSIQIINTERSTIPRRWWCEVKREEKK